MKFLVIFRARAYYNSYRMGAREEESKKRARRRERERKSASEGGREVKEPEEVFSF